MWPTSFSWAWVSGHRFKSCVVKMVFVCSLFGQQCNFFLHFYWKSVGNECPLNELRSIVLFLKNIQKHIIKIIKMPLNFYDHSRSTIGKSVSSWVSIVQCNFQVADSFSILHMGKKLIPLASLQTLWRGSTRHPSLLKHSDINLAGRTDKQDRKQEHTGGVLKERSLCRALGNVLRHLFWKSSG